MRQARSSAGFWAGVAAGAAATAVLFAYRGATGTPTLPEVLAERMIRLLPYQVFALLLAHLQHLAKPLALAGAVALLLVGFGLGGAAAVRLVPSSRWPGAFRAVLVALATWVILTWIVLPAVEGTLLGVPLTTTVPHPALPFALASAVYGGLLAALSGRGRRAVAPASLSGPGGRGGAGDPGSRGLGRRDVLRRSALAALVAVAGGPVLAWSPRSLAGTIRSRGADAARTVFRLLKGMPPEVTPTAQFYQVSKNFFDPVVDVSRWTLHVTGLVGRPLKLSLEELKASAPPVERYQTLECISNEVGGDLISTARWKGVRMRDVLGAAQVDRRATTVIMRSVDGYSESIPLAVAMDPTTLLAYEMNGEPLPQKHGAPVRVLILNRYGMKQPKWLTTIELADHPYTGYWEQQGWSQEAIVKTNSAFRVEVREDGVLLLGGWAFAGSRGIARVEISADGGRSWFPAALKGPLGVNCWQFWSAEWRPPAPGTYTLEVRAVDGTGQVQPQGPKPTLPDGAEGYHTVRVRFG
jgi:DMSO/TMAO reductase YedYZ molybdopterin-dependent catalytic subunit